MKMSKNRLLGIMMLILSLVFAYGTSKLPPSNIKGDPGPALYPYFVAVVLGLAALVVIFQKPKEEKQFMTKDELKRMALLFGLFILYALLFYLIGVYRTVPIVLFSLCYLFSRGKNVPLWKMLVYTLAMWAFIYILFKYVIVMAMPKGKLFY